MSENAFALHIGTLISEADGKPWVTIQVIAQEPSGREVMVAGLKLSPEDARDKAGQFFQAAEFADATANVVLSLREQKVTEDQVLAAIGKMKERRGRY